MAKKKRRGWKETKHDDLFNEQREEEYVPDGPPMFSFGQHDEIPRPSLADWVRQLGFVGVCPKCNNLIKSGGNCIGSGEAVRHRNCPKSVVAVIIEDLAREKELMDAELRRLGCDTLVD